MKKILLVDDEKETTAVFELALKEAGYEVVIAYSGKEGLDAALSDHFDVILLDQMLPDTPGNEILKTLKANDATKAIPVAMLTNFGNDAMINEALGNGADEYLLKYSVAPQDLIVKVKSMLHE